MRSTFIRDNYRWPGGGQEAELPQGQARPGAIRSSLHRPGAAPTGAATRDARSPTRNGPKQACDAHGFHGLHTESTRAGLVSGQMSTRAAALGNRRFELAELHYTVPRLC